MYDSTITGLLSYIYPLSKNIPLTNFEEQRGNRSAIIQIQFGIKFHSERLPTPDNTVTWTDGIHYYRVLSRDSVKGKGRGAARFQVRCPECSKWFSVGKFMLHAKVHPGK